jgi:hypothetical protein
MGHGIQLGGGVNLKFVLHFSIKLKLTLIKHIDLAFARNETSRFVTLYVHLPYL